MKLTPSVIAWLLETEGQVLVRIETARAELVTATDVVVRVVDEPEPVRVAEPFIRLIQEPYEWDRPPEPRSWPTTTRQAKPRQSRNGFAQAARLPCYRGTRTR